MIWDVLLCVRDEHDARLIGLAAIVCFTATATGVRLLRLARSSTRTAQARWLAATSLIMGSGVWATHFIAMLGYDPGVVVGYDIWITFASLVLVVAALFLGVGIAMTYRSALAVVPAAIVTGVGIAGMHYLGMEAVLIPAGIVRSIPMMVLSVVASLALIGPGLHLTLHRSGRASLLSATVLLGLGVLALHFGGMASLTVVPFDATSLDRPSFSSVALGVAIGGIALVVLAMTFAIGFLVWQADASLWASERQFRALVQGIVDCAIYMLDAEGRVTSWNAGATRLKGYRPEEALGRPLAEFYSAEDRKAGVPERELAAARRDGTIATTGWAWRRDGRRFWADVTMERISDDLGEVQGFARIIRDRTRQKEEEDRIRHMALHDGLTGLLNRGAFEAEFDSATKVARTRGAKLAVVVIDLDRFKHFNDLHGHAVGDGILRELGARLLAWERTGSVSARLGGDEFAVLIHHRADSHLEARLRDLRQRILEPVQSEGLLVRLQASIGVALYPTDGGAPSVLITRADLARHRSLETPGHPPRRYAPDMDEARRRRRGLRADLAGALDRSEMELVYQPQRLVRTGALIGYEALVRWHHPERGLVSPADFIALAESSGEIVRLGAWVLQAACEAATTLPEEVRMAVNLSPVQLLRADFPDVVARVLDATRLPPSRLELEVTETGIVGDPDVARVLLRRVKDLGVAVSMDDFGTGHSSLAALGSFPFDRIKIDRSFLTASGTSPEARTIVRATLALGRSLGMAVLAEGLETEAQLAFLREEGCEEAQGFLWGRPGRLIDPVTRAVGAA